MSKVKVYGPINGAGVQVRELALQEGGEAAPLGTTLLVGTADCGPPQTAKVLELLGEVDFDRQYGRTLAQGVASQSALTLPRHAPLFFEGARKANGTTAGTLWCLRVTNGEEIKAGLALWPRNLARNQYAVQPQAHKGSPNTLPEPRVRFESKYGGTGYGPAHHYSSTIANIVTALVGPGLIVPEAATPPSSTLSAWDALFNGAEVRFPILDPSFSAFVVSTDDHATGFTIEIDRPYSAAILAGAGAQLITIQRHAANEDFGQREEGLFVSAEDAGDGNRFNLQVTKQPNAHVLRMENVGIEGPQDVEDALSNQPLQEWLTADTQIGDSFNPALDLEMPADWAGVAQPGSYVATRRLNLRVAYWQKDEGAGAFDAYLDQALDLVVPTGALRCLIVCTFTAATTFTVDVQAPEGSALPDAFGTIHPTGSLPGGTLGTLWASGVPWLPDFTLRAGSVPATAGNTISILMLTLPADAAERGAVLYPAAGTTEGDTGQKIRVAANGPDWIDLAISGAVSDHVTAPLGPTQDGTIDGVPTFTLAGGETFICTMPEGTVITLTEAGLGAGAHTVAAVVAEFNALELARATSAPLKRIEFFITDDDPLKMNWRILRDHGPGATVTLGAGTINAIAGFVAGAVVGTGGQLVRVQFPQALVDGFNGMAPSDADVEAALSFGPADPAFELLESNTGAVGVGVPSFSTVAATGIAAARLAEQFASVAVLDFPTNVQTEGGAKAHVLASLSGGSWDDHRATYFPPGGWVKPPDRQWANAEGSPVQRALSGYILGVIARNAEALGYAEAPAGWEKGVISPFVVALSTGDRVLDSELLTGFGINEIRKRGNAIALFGDRIRSQNVGADGTRRIWMHERFAIGHIVRTLLWSLQPLVFVGIDAFGLARARRIARDLLLPFQVAGWFDDSGGPSFEDQVSIRSDGTNNTSATAAAGNLAIGIGFKIKGTAERVVVSLDPNGASVSSS